jgi:hypothetical protein
MLSHLKTIVATIKKIRQYGIPSYILSFGDSLGDNLLLTTLAKGLYDQGYRNIWIKCNHPRLFDHNPFVKLILPFDTLLSTGLLKLFNVRLCFPRYTFYQENRDQDVIPEKHIILKMADSIGLKGPIANKPIFNFAADEDINGTVSPDQIVIVTSTSGAKVPMRNKEWYTDRYQQIVNRFYGQYKFIQLGSGNDEPLYNVLDLRGKTSVRESAAILKKSTLMITHVGFMMHLARAVDCRSVIIYGGRERPEQSGYACFENIYSAIECSPCWLHNTCLFEKKCMTVISAEVVEDAIIKQLGLKGKPLPVEFLDNE